MDVVAGNARHECECGGARCKPCKPRTTRGPDRSVRRFAHLHDFLGAFVCVWRRECLDGKRMRVDTEHTGPDAGDVDGAVTRGQHPPHAVLQCRSPCGDGLQALAVPHETSLVAADPQASRGVFGQCRDRHAIQIGNRGMFDLAADGIDAIARETGRVARHMPVHAEGAPLRRQIGKAAVHHRHPQATLVIAEQAVGKVAGQAASHPGRGFFESRGTIGVDPDEAAALGDPHTAIIVAQAGQRFACGADQLRTSVRIDMKQPGAGGGIHAAGRDT